jgi:outer membrane protein TolC
MMWNVFIALQISATLPDSLPFEDFYRRVLAAHPVARQARLLDTVAVAKEQAARGAFDPKLTASWDRKRFDAKAYFDYLDAELSIPTRSGVDVKVGFERTGGVFASPDRRTPSAGLVTAGLSIPIGQRLVTDERRVALAQARAMRDYAAAERDAILNKLLATAASAFADWYEADRRLGVAGEGVRLATVRMEALRARVLQGDAAAIDTLEASLELARRRLSLREAALAGQNAAVVIEGMLWDDRGQPQSLGAAVRPGQGGVPAIAALAASDDVSSWARLHPELRKATAKVREESAERALAQQRLFVPNVTASVAALAAQGASLGAFEQNGKVAAALSIPLLLRKERGTLGASTAKVDQLAAERALTARGVLVATTAASNELRALDELLELQQQVVAQARRLREGEEQKFAAGESTVFLVTARERLVLDEEVKRIALEAKRFVAVGKLTVAAGMFLFDPVTR